MTTLTPAMPPARWFPGAACFRGVLLADTLIGGTR